MVQKKIHLYMEKVRCLIVNETWKDIKDYKNLYMVSNNGSIKSLKRNTAHERILKPRKDRGGYLYVGLLKNGKTKYCKIHRLVAEAFIPNPENKYSVNHIDGNKTNNKVENLEWATRSEQMIHAYKLGLIKWTDESKGKLKNTMINKGLWYLNKPQKDIKKHCKGHVCGAVPVVQKNDNGEVIKIWKSMSEASRTLGIPVPHIVRVCKGRRKHSGGYIWEYYKGGGSND